MAVSLKTDLRFPESGQHGHGSRIIHLFPELVKAHQDNDRAVMQAYGFTKGSEAYKSEAACVAELMKLYQKKVEELEKR